MRHDMLVCARCSRQITERSALSCPACRYTLTQLHNDPWWNRPGTVGAILAALLLVLGVAGQLVH
ncbi:MAG: hypothetical protein JWM67_2853 [Mycobacterium sp.]|jgi:hypothetical protein|nr:hypothetical protein [Mycobacterium sp.]